MKYLVEYFNIQGFVGYHSFTLGEGINSISSKYNGTGKSTLFDCLRLLAIRGNHDKDDLFYMINHNALEAFFRMTTVEGETYGFYMNKEKGSFLYTRKLLEDEMVQWSEYAYPEMWEKLNLFVKGGNYVNIADRFIDLFSSSNITFNSGLVQELMLHEETEKAYAELLSRMEYSKEEMTQKFSEANTLMAQRDSLSFYPKLAELHNILYNEELAFNYETMVAILEEVSHLQKEWTHIYLDYNYTHLFKIKEQISGLSPTQKLVDLSMMSQLINLIRLQQEVFLLLPINGEVSSFFMSILKHLSDLKKAINSLEEEVPLIKIPKGLLHLQKLKEAIGESQEERPLVKIETTNARTLLELQQLIREMQQDMRLEIYHRHEHKGVQKRLVGLVCPTCSQVLGREDSLCEHLSL